MTSEPPVLLLDIDGVLNVHPWRGGWGGPLTRILPGPVYYEPRLVERLRDFHTCGVAEVRWSTTWCGYEPQLVRLEQVLGLRFERAFSDRPMSKTWAELKAEAAVAALAEGRRIVWVDDSEVNAGRRFYPVISEAERERRALLIQPDSARGLQPEHLEQIRAFSRVLIKDGGGKDRRP